MTTTLLKTLIATAALAAVTGASAQTKLKWAHVYETSEPFHTASVWAAEEIKKRTAGRYTIDVYPASQLGKENDINQGLTLGTVDIIISGSSFAAKSFPRIGVTYYPYTFRGVEHLLAYTKSDIYKELTKGYEEKSGNHIVATTYYGVRHTTSNKPITKCADMKGLKIRVTENPVHITAFRTLGASPTPMSWPEVIGALQQGTIDGQENPISVIVSAKLWQVQKHMSLTSHVYAPMALMVSPSFWASLNDAQKAAFTEGARAGALASRKFVDDVEKKGVEEIKSHGMQVVMDVDKAAFKTAMAPAYKQYATKFGQKTMDDISNVK